MGEVHDFDAGDLGCGTGLPRAFAERMRSIAVGDVLGATVRDAADREDLPAVARMLGHRVQSVEDAPDGRQAERLAKWPVLLMVVCGLLVLAGVAAIVRWGELQPEPPWSTSDPDETRSPGEVARRYIWYVTVAVVSGLASGLLVAGAGGRLAMRLLAATAEDAAQGRVTEAGQVVGKITVGGTSASSSSPGSSSVWPAAPCTC